MPHISEWWQRYYKTIFLGLFLIVYVGVGIHTESLLWARKPLPVFLIEDFRYYQRALNDALQGISPYSLLRIGPGYFYPPPALFIVEIFSAIPDLLYRSISYAIVNIILLLIGVDLIRKSYGYAWSSVWYWYILALFFAPFLEILHIGQINTFTVFGLFLLFYFEEQSVLLSSIGLNLAVLTKLSPIVFLPYLVARHKYRIIIVSLVMMLFLLFLASVRYGSHAVLDYPSVLQWLVTQFRIDTNSQSLIAKIATISEVTKKIPGLQGTYSWEFNYSLAQRLLTLYFMVIVLVSSLMTFFKPQPREFLFIITGLSMTISPNILWYHHYLFAFLPLLIWLGWRKTHAGWRIWILGILLLIQWDRYHLTYGLLIHLSLHLSILVLLYQQFRDFITGYWFKTITVTST